MADGGYFMLVVVGGVFIVLGLVGILWGRHEEKSYFDSIAARPGDQREFMNHWPERPQPGALRVGGWIAIAAGVVMLIVGLVNWLFLGGGA